MPFRISRRPRGLLQYLDARNQGDNPSEVLEQVRPTVSLDPWFGVETLYCRQIRVNGITAGQSFSIAPGGLDVTPHTWRIHQFSFNIQILTSGQGTEVGLFLTKPPAGIEGATDIHHPIKNVELTAGYAGQNFVVSWEPVQPIIIYGPDTQLRATLSNAFIPGGANVLVSCLVQRFLEN